MAIKFATADSCIVDGYAHPIASCGDSKRPSSFLAPLSRNSVALFKSYLADVFVPEGTRFQIPHPDAKPLDNFGDGFVVYRACFQRGLTLPPHPFILGFLARRCCTLAQVNPNALGCLHAYLVLCEENDVLPDATEFISIFTTRFDPQLEDISISAKAGCAFFRRVKLGVNWPAEWFVVYPPPGRALGVCYSGDICKGPLSAPAPPPDCRMKAILKRLGTANDITTFLTADRLASIRKVPHSTYFAI